MKKCNKYLSSRQRNKKRFEQRIMPQILKDLKIGKEPQRKSAKEINK